MNNAAGHQGSIPREPFFWFDVWQCLKCGNVVSGVSYRTITTDIQCPCRKALFSDYRHVPAKMVQPDGRR